MNQRSKSIRIFRMGAFIAVVALGAYIAGARWGQRDLGREIGVMAQGGAAHGASSGPALTESESRTVKIYSQASPAVANINTRAVEYDFFRNAVPVEGAGSGFVIDPRGYVLTNYHVVEGAQTIEVTLGDRSQYPGKFVGADEYNDVALVKIDPKGKTLPALALGDSSNLLVGQSVLAIGNPFGFSSTLTTGVVSALGRTVQTGESTVIEDAIQTDAAINHGNSGGPLLNSRGEVIGINSAIYTPTGATAGIGFAIPINTAKSIAQDLINEGRVHRASIGLPAVVELWPDLAEALDLPVKHGLLIEQVSQNGAAARAGLHGGDRYALLGLHRLVVGGDVLVALDGKDVSTQLDMDVILNHEKPGQTVKATIYRSGKKMEVDMTLTEQPEPSGR
jgi:S1-C subfamily serine protease